MRVPRSAGMSAAPVSDVGALVSGTSRGRGSPRVSRGRAGTVKRHCTTTSETATSLGLTNYTYLGGNSWFAEMGVSSVKVLCDPWLVGDLTFWDLPALYTGRKASLAGGPQDWMAIAKRADVILLSQGWEDHTHRPTLKSLPKDIPVVGSPSACNVATELGFTNVTALHANDKVTVKQRGNGDISDGQKQNSEPLVIHATRGAQVGPPWSERECGFFLADGKDGVRVYYEPHCSYDELSVRQGLRAVGNKVHLCITPVMSVDVFGFPLVSGGDEAVDLLEVLNRPKLVVPLRNGELEQEGISTVALGTDGTTGDTFKRLCDARFGVGEIKTRMPTPGETIEIVGT